MIPRYQRVVFWCLVAGIALMGLLLVRGCARNHQRLAVTRDLSPIPAPVDTAAEPVTIATANDADNSVTLDQVTLPLPADPALRARTLLERMLADAAQPASLHPLPAGPAVTDVFLVPLPLTNPGPTTLDSPLSNPFGDTPQTERLNRRYQNQEPGSPYGTMHGNGAQLAVINLTKSFCEGHPSGILAEDLTLRAILATLQANLPHVEQVRFLVDGQSRDTLAGHADLTRPYAVQDPTRSIHTLGPDGSLL